MYSICVYVSLYLDPPTPHWLVVSNITFLSFSFLTSVDDFRVEILLKERLSSGVGCVGGVGDGGGVNVSKTFKGKSIFGFRTDHSPGDRQVKRGGDRGEGVLNRLPCGLQPCIEKPFSINACFVQFQIQCVSCPINALLFEVSVPCSCLSIGGQESCLQVTIVLLSVRLVVKGIFFYSCFGLDSLDYLFPNFSKQFSK